jgi:two-component system response regulator (stage 0 sporulation protein F)
VTQSPGQRWAARGYEGPARPASGVWRRGRPCRVLVADDDDSIRECIAEILSEDPDFTVLSARDGVEAVALARAAEPDVLLLDQRMPRLCGAEVVQALRADGPPDLEIILVSAVPDVRGLAEKLGLGGYLAKPFGCDELFAALSTVLARGRHAMKLPR